MANLQQIQQCIWKDRGVLTEMLEYSLTGPAKFTKALVTIDSTGCLNGDSDRKKNHLIDRLHSCQMQVRSTGNGSGVLLVTSFNGSQSVYLKMVDSDQFNRVLGALIVWQSLKPRGISYKRLSVPFHGKGSDKTAENLLVASCKIYGFVPKMKNLGLLPNGPKVSLFSNDNSEKDAGNSDWFTAIVVLKSNGILELINESDGQLIYAVDIKKLRKGEIRELHHSLFESSNYLYIGTIPKLRDEGMFSNSYQSPNSLTPDISLQYFNKVHRIILEFPYRIDVEDWLVTLSSFTIKEYVGIDKSNSLSVSRRIQFGILEAEYYKEASGLYVEIQIWSKPWFRTSIVPDTSNPFFREEFEIDLPITTTTLIILLKSSSDLNSYQASDKILGASVIEYKKFKHESFNDKIPIYDINNTEIGKLFISSKVSRNYILPTNNFNNLEKMILNLDFLKLYKFIINQTTNLKLEEISVILLDIFQSLNKENEWFNTLIQEEVKCALMKDQSDLFNSLFRGNSILTKSLELYNLRVGQEYLEQVIGIFINNVITDFKPIEVDPMRITVEDGQDKEEIIELNFQNLLKLIKEIWQRIYKSSKDLPNQIKIQLSILRKSIELYSIDNSTSLNSISSFIFLRFFCPVILNPKLFFLTKNHQFGDVKRCLTLISKILMKFANRQEFDLKDPYLIKFNDEFLKTHKDELLDYIDKITMRKLDFTEKHLKLSTSLERTELPLLTTNNDFDKDSLTVPFLIDKYLRLDQLIDIITYDPKFDDVDNDPLVDDFGYCDQEIIHNEEEEEEDEIRKELKKSYTIGSLEFEKLILETNMESDSFEFGDEKFIKTLLKTDESDQVYDYINSDTSLYDLIVESNKLKSKRKRLMKKLSAAESNDSLIQGENDVKVLLSNTIVDSNKNILKLDPMSIDNTTTNLKKLNIDSSYNSLKLKFNNSPNDDFSSIISSAHSPTKKLGKLIRSASINTLSSFTIALDDKSSPSKSRTFGRWFKR